MFYTIGDIAKMLHIPPSTLRYYDKEGLLPFVERSNGGLRMFKEEDLSWLTLIECLKKTGMPIKDIKTFIDWSLSGDETIGERLALIRERREVVLKQIEEMKGTLAVLDYKCWYYETAEKAGTCSVHDSMPLEEMPEPFRHFKNHSPEMRTAN